jgi:microcin C transport system ATP-binding protein
MSDAEQSGVPILDIQNLKVGFWGKAGLSPAVKGIDIQVSEGETVALVGESGSGKSVTALSVLQLLAGSAEMSGSVRYRGEELVGAATKTLRHVRGNEISMIFQEPMTALNPLHTIERQISESLKLHAGVSGENARAKVLELMHQVGIRDPETRLGAYPHQLSGGQRQRVMIAMALANGPELLIADEPTTALDVTVQAQILELLADLKRDMGMGMLFITHDLSIVRKISDRVYVMKDGEVVEHGPTWKLFAAPEHDYTRMLLSAEPTGLPEPIPDPTSAPVIEGENIKVWFPIKEGFFRKTVGHVKAVQDISCQVRAGETLGVVGESGSGKTTLGLALVRLISSQGRIAFLGRDIQGLKQSKLRPLRRDMQVVFQDPYGSLSPRMSVAQIIGEGLDVHGIGASGDDRRKVIGDALIEVGLEPSMMDRYPHEFSGGQRQRISIARAMALKPKLVVLDEPTSALDMSVQSQIVDLLRDLQVRYKLAYVFISHDLKVVRALSHRVIVMRNGVVVEEGVGEAVFENPQTDYARALMAAAFRIEAEGEGEVVAS